MVIILGTGTKRTNRRAAHQCSVKLLLLGITDIIPGGQSILNQFAINSAPIESMNSSAAQNFTSSSRVTGRGLLIKHSHSIFPLTNQIVAFISVISKRSPALDFSHFKVFSNMSFQSSENPFCPRKPSSLCTRCCIRNTRLGIVAHGYIKFDL